MHSAVSGGGDPSCPSMYKLFTSAETSRYRSKYINIYPTYGILRHYFLYPSDLLQFCRYVHNAAGTLIHNAGEIQLHYGDLGRQVFALNRVQLTMFFTV